MRNVLSKEKRQQILARGRFGWSLRPIENATGVRRETASNYLKATGLTVRGRGSMGNGPSAGRSSSNRPSSDGWLVPNGRDEARRRGPRMTQSTA